ncbi:substrate-binding domain-containing protein [Streptomyces sp. 7R007]
MSRVDPRGKANRALLVGVSEYDHTEPPHGVPGDLPAVKHNLDRLGEVLPRAGVFAADEVTVLHSPHTKEFEQALHPVIEEAEGLLLVYFAGHGAIPSAADELFLQLRGAGVYAGAETGVFPGAEMFTTVLGMLGASRAERIVVVLDCCFAGNAAWIWERFPDPDRRRTLLLTSVQANHRIDAGDPDTPTPFTALLARLLEEEPRAGTGELWFGELAERLRERMRAARLRTVRGLPWEPLSRAEPGEDVLLAAALPRPAPPPPPPPPPPPRRLRERLRLREALRRARAAVLRLLRALHRTVLFGLLLAVLATGLGSCGLSALLASHTTCAPPLELRVLTDPDLEPTVTSAADAYLTSDANRDGDGCRRTGITVYSAGAADAVDALGRQTEAWREPRDEDTNPQRDIGPQPDVWIPASPADVQRVTHVQDSGAVARLQSDAHPLAYSPVVLAVPQNIAGASQAERTAPTLARLLEDLRRRDKEAEVRRPDPEFTDAALLATTGLYGTAGARAEREAAQPGPPARTAADLLCTLPDDDAVDQRTAALVPEFLLKTGVGCDRTTRTPRLAEYADDVPGIEPTFVRVRWADADRDEGAREDAADRFHAWLAGEGGRKVFARDGFRAATGRRDLLDEDDVGDGVRRILSQPFRPAGREAMDTALKEYRGAHGPGRVLFLLDSSGSMAGLWQGPSGGPGLLKQSLGGLGPQDEYGVWAVAGTSGRPYTVLLEFGQHRRPEAESTIDGGAKVRDAEADPHAALLAALDDMAHRGADDDRPQLVVYVTDDEDDSRLTGAALRQVLARARSVKVPVTMVSLVGGGCDRGRPDAGVSGASGGRCLDADDDLGTGLADEVARTGTGED